MPLVNAHAAGIDISDKEQVVAVGENICAERVRKFGAMTCDLQSIAAWLKECNIETVAMESTGVYWRPFQPAGAGGFRGLPCQFQTC